MKRIAIVGCGAIAKSHGLAIQDLGYECVAVTSRRVESATTFAQKYAELRADWLTVPEWMTDAGRAKLRAMFPAPQVYPNYTDHTDVFCTRKQRWHSVTSSVGPVLACSGFPRYPCHPRHPWSSCFEVSRRP